MILFDKIYFLAMLPSIFIWLIVTRGSKEMPLSLNDIYEDVKCKNY